MTLTQLKIIGVIIVLLVAGFIVERFWTRNNNPEPISNQINFNREGTLFKDNPGLKPGVWFLSYEEAGKPGLKAELSFPNPNSDLAVGQRVKIQGREANGVVEVVTLDILNAYKSNLIWVDTPLPNQTVISPITLHGYAKSSWYFEASFPIKLFDGNGKLIAQTAASALTDWTAGGYVEFMASLNYSSVSTKTGTLILQKDNPSDLPQNADQISFPVKFGTEGRAVKLYYYNPQKDMDEQGNVLASRQGLVAVDRQIPITITPIQDTIQLLLKGELTDAERAQGVTTEFPLPGVELKSANLKNQVLTLEFADPNNKTSGGSARVGILWFQIEATAKQFPGVAEVKFKPAELFQP